MSDHLPECQPTDPDDGPLICICRELRACEERVKVPLLAIIKAGGRAYAEGWEWGRGEALDEAREAVAAMPLTGGWTTPDGVIEEIDKAKTVAAIDALREKS